MKAHGIVLFCLFISDPDKIGQLLSDSIFEAHQRTCLLSREQIQVGCSQGVSQFKVEQFKKMVRCLFTTYKKHLITLFFFLGLRWFVDTRCSEVDECYSANYWIRQDGSRFYAVSSRWSNCVTESRWVQLTWKMINFLQFMHLTDTFDKLNWIFC